MLPVDFTCVFITEDNSNAPERMASVQGTPEQVQKVQSMINEIIEQVIEQIYWSFTCRLCCVVALDKKLYSTLSLFTQVCKWVPAITMLGVTL